MGARGRQPAGQKAPPKTQLVEEPSFIGASAQEILEEFVPLVIKAATDSATGLSMAAAAMASLEKEIREQKTEIRDLKTEISQLKSTERGKGKNAKAWLEFLKSIFTPAVILQLLIMLGMALGLYSQIPQDHSLENHDTIPEQPKRLKASDKDVFEP